MAILGELWTLEDEWVTANSVLWIWGRSQLDEQGIRFSVLQKGSVNLVPQKYPFLLLCT